MNNYLEILKKNGKSFYWAGQLLPKKYLIRCAELYSFCRLLDDIADSKIKADNLSILKNILNLIKKDDYQKLKNYKINIPDYLKKSELAKAKIIDLIDGLIFDQKQVRIKNERELILYCYRVAGTVGVSLSIGVSLAKNTIVHTVEAYIANASSITTTSGGVTAYAESAGVIDATSWAASIAADPRCQSASWPARNASCSRTAIIPDPRGLPAGRPAASARTATCGTVANREDGDCRSASLACAYRLWSNAGRPIFVFRMTVRRPASHARASRYVRH